MARMPERDPIDLRQSTSVTEARTTTTIRKAPGRRASDAGRSRLGDLTRPIAKAQRITPNRRPALVLGLLALFIVGAIATALFGLPVRTWFEQDRELKRLDTELAELQSVNADLQREVDRLGTTSGIAEAAREEIGYTELGERRETMLDLPDLPTNFPNGWPYNAVERIIAVRGAGN
jgi:cell division protein FtsB